MSQLKDLFILLCQIAYVGTFLPLVAAASLFAAYVLTRAIANLAFHL